MKQVFDEAHRLSCAKDRPSGRFMRIIAVIGVELHEASGAKASAR